jgi:hypothetical protein
LGTPLISKKDVRLAVQCFSGDKCWIPIEAARSDNPLPVIEYAKKQGLGKHPKWRGTMEFDIDILQNLRRAFISKYENTPKYKFGVQIPTSISHALRLDRLNGNHLWQEAIQTEMDQMNEYQTFRVPKVVMIFPLTSTSLTIWCLIANLMADERGD